jgi:hypothetical protein
VHQLYPHEVGILRRAAAKAKKTLERERAKAASDPIWDYLRLRLRGYRKNAEVKRTEFELTDADLSRLYARAQGCCEVTGVRFSVETFGSSRAPFAPSIDRIDCHHGYTRRNVRLVCQIANLAMNVWGDTVWKAFIEQAKPSEF